VNGAVNRFTLSPLTSIITTPNKNRSRYHSVTWTDGWNTFETKQINATYYVRVAIASFISTANHGS
jgi:hypothetical protein